MTSLNKARLHYALMIIRGNELDPRRPQHVPVLTLDEQEDLIARALDGEFDAKAAQFAGILADLAT